MNIDPSKIGGPNFFPPDKVPQPGKNEPLKGPQKKDKSENNQVASSQEDNELGALMKLPPHKVVGKLNSLLEKSLNDPKIEKLLIDYRIAPNSKQALAFCTYSCIKQLLGKRFHLNPEDEKALFEAIQLEYEEDSAKEQIDPDERKRRKKERRQKSKSSVNVVMILIQESLKTLERDHGGLSVQS
jgi:hypothetical protein